MSESTWLPNLVGGVSIWKLAVDLNEPKFFDGRLLVPDMWSELHGPTSWLFSLALGLAGALLGYLIFTVGLGIGDTDVFDFGGIISAIIGTVIVSEWVSAKVRHAII